MTDSNKQPEPPRNTPPQQPNDPKNNPSPFLRGLLTWVVVLGVLLITLRLWHYQQGTYETVTYPVLQQYVESGRVKKVEIVIGVSGLDTVKGEAAASTNQVAAAPVPQATTNAPRAGEPPFDLSKAAKFKVLVDHSQGRDLTRLLLRYGVEPVWVEQNVLLWQIASSVLPVILIFGLLYFFFMRQAGGGSHGALSFGKSRARMLTQDKRKVTFADVAGAEEAKEETHEIIDFLKDPKRFQKLGGRIPKGVLLTGPPGTGKTLLAKAIAGEADVPFFSISGSDFVEMFVGVGASRVRDMFEQGKKSAPCIIFIDEIDAVGRSRFTGIGGGHDEREQTLNALLVQMDGFETQEGVIIVAATNRPDVLDPALLRPGRFDRQIVIDLPTIDGREAILKIHSKTIKMSGVADLRRIARGTPGFSGADLANLMNEAALLAARQGKESVENHDLEEARDKVKWGRERRSRKLDEKEKRITAYHEAGHAVVLHLTEDTEPLHKITIIPRGIAYLGATMQLPEKDRHTEGRKRLLAQLAGMMGGRAAEELVLDDITSGASSDIKHATHIARLMVCSWGMSEVLGPQAFGDNQEYVFLGREISRTQDYSEETARKIDSEVSRILREAHEGARALLVKHRETLDRVANTLIERETLDGRDLADLVADGRIHTEEEREQEDLRKKEEEEAAAVKPSPSEPPPIAAA
jgi:cell division protease FtsH